MSIFQGTLRTEYIETVARDTKKFRFSVVESSPLSPDVKDLFQYQPGHFLSLKFKTGKTDTIKLLKQKTITVPLRMASHHQLPLPLLRGLGVQETVHLPSHFIVA